MKRTVPDGKNAADGEISVNDVRVFQVAGPRGATGGFLWREGRRHGMLWGRLYAMMACRPGVPVSRVTGFPVGWFSETVCNGWKTGEDRCPDGV